MAEEKKIDNSEKGKDVGNAGNQKEMESTQNDNAEAAKKYTDDQKLFVGELKDIESNDLKEYFSKFGEILEVQTTGTGKNGKPRGFGFITFASAEIVNKILEAPSHTIKSKKIDVQRVKSRPELKQIFVKGLDKSLTDSDIREHFEKYGKIEKLDQPNDKVTNERGTYCFITFESATMAEEASKLAKQSIGDKECNVEKANVRRGSRGGRRGRGRGFRGNYQYGFRGGYGNGFNSYGDNYNSFYANDYYDGWDGSYGFEPQPSNYGKFKRGSSFRGGRGKYQPYGGY